jgi:hypothetical protein
MKINTPCIEELEKLLKVLQRTETKPELLKDVTDSQLKEYINQNVKENLKTFIKALQKKVSELKRGLGSVEDVKTSKVADSELRDKVLAIIYRGEDLDVAGQIKVVECAKVYLQKLNTKNAFQIEHLKQLLALSESTGCSKDEIIKILMKEESNVKKDGNPTTIPTTAPIENFIYIDSIVISSGCLGCESLLSLLLVNLSTKKVVLFFRDVDDDIPLIFEQLKNYNMDSDLVIESQTDETVSMLFKYREYIERKMKLFQEIKLIPNELKSFRDIPFYMGDIKSISTNNSSALLGLNLNKMNIKQEYLSLTKLRDLILD